MHLDSLKHCKFFELFLLGDEFLDFFGPFFNIDITALAASDPLLGFELLTSHLFRAWLMLYAVIIPLPIGLLKLIERFKIALKVDEHIKSK